ncbi:MAG: hypothetical protein ACYS32_00455 [Planctomycetota bacterium]|jgi:hypothetical protein
MYWFTSDQHFDHFNIIKHCYRMHGNKKKKYPVRIPTPKPTEWHKDKSKYKRKRKHKKEVDNEY